MVRRVRAGLADHGCALSSREAAVYRFFVWVCACGRTDQSAFPNPPVLDTDPMDWPAFPADVAAHVRARLSDRHRLMLSAASRRDRAAWRHDESIRLSEQPASVALLPLHQRRAFLTPARPSLSAAEVGWTDNLGNVVRLPVRAFAEALHFQVLLGDDGAVWASWTGFNCGGLLERISVPPAVPGAGHPAVRSIACGLEHVALIRADGAVWVAGRGQSSSALLDEELPEALSDLQFRQADLGGERAAQVAAGDHIQYVLTEPGRIWGWEWGRGALWGFAPLDNSDGSGSSDAGDGLDNDAASAPRPLSQLVDGSFPPPFARMAADEHGLCAVARDGRICACGKGVFRSTGARPRLLAALPHPPPAPVRDLLSAGDRSILELHVSADGTFARTFLAQAPSDKGGIPRSVGPLALLVDGTVWSVLGQQRVPFCDGVLAVRSDSGGPIFVRPGGQRLQTSTAALWRASASPWG